MLRLETKDGWWLVTHPDHAYLAGDFASRWGNETFALPEPREHVLRGIYAHDDGWRARDAQPMVTKQGKPAAFSKELVGAYSAFEEIDLEAYLTVRRNAVNLMAEEDAYAAILISMHTYNLLSARADRSTINPEELPLLDAFLIEQLALQETLRERLVAESTLPDEMVSREKLRENFQLLQACDNLSLVSCVDFNGAATLLWPQRLRHGGTSEVQVHRTGERTFRLDPYPFAEQKITFRLKARFVEGATFASSEELAAKLAASSFEDLDVTVTA